MEIAVACRGKRPLMLNLRGSVVAESCFILFFWGDTVSDFVEQATSGNYLTLTHKAESIELRFSRPPHFFPDLILRLMRVFELRIAMRDPTSHGSQRRGAGNDLPVCLLKITDMSLFADA